MSSLDFHHFVLYYPQNMRTVLKMLHKHVTTKSYLNVFYETDAVKIHKHHVQ